LIALCISICSCRDPIAPSAPPQVSTAATQPAVDASAPPVSQGPVDASVASQVVDAPPALDAAAFDTSVAAFDAGPKASIAKLPLNKPSTVCGMEITLTHQGHKQYADPPYDVIGIWEFKINKGTAKSIGLEQRESSLYIEGSAFGCMYVIEGEQGSERVTAMPIATKPFTEDEAAALAQAEVNARKLPQGEGRNSSNRDGVYDVTFMAKASHHTNVRVGLYTRRVISIKLVPAP
jgi:hypothetical protein